MNILDFNHFVIDSRKVTEGSVFIALQSGKQDGNDFAQDALNKGAAFLILNKTPHFEVPDNKYIVVKNSIDYISSLAKQKFNNLIISGTKTVSLTGSIGKTTTKDFIIFLLKQSGKAVWGTEGNLNNHIGLPLTILNSPKNIDFLILEMGMNAPGEISYLTSISSTDVRIITNISPAHIGNFDKGLEGIFEAKTEILQNSKPQTTLICPLNLALLDKIKQKFIGKIITTSQITNFEIIEGATHFNYLNNRFIINKIVTQNWLSSLAIGFEVLKHFKIDLPKSILNFELPSGRGNKYQLSNNTILLDESYNASIESVKNAAQNLSLYKGKKIAVIGGMKELGKLEESLHKEVYNFIKSFEGIDLIFVGKEFLFTSSKESWFESPQQVPLDTIKNYNVILVKASNSSGLNVICKALLNKFNLDLKSDKPC